MLTIHTLHWPRLRWKNPTITSSWIGWGFLITNISFTATYNIFAKFLTGSLSPLSLLFLSELLTIFFTLFFFGAVPLFKAFLRLERRKFAPMLTIGLMNGIIAPLLWFSGLQYTSAVNASLFSSTEMMFLMILAVLLLKEEWTFLHFCSTMTIALGIATISLRGFSDGLDIQIGDFLLILASFSFSMGSIIFRKYLHGTDPQLVIFIRSLSPVAGIFLISPFLESPLAHELPSLSYFAIAALLGFGLISRFMNTFTFYEAIDRLPVSTVSMFSHLTMVAAIFFARIFLGEAIEFYHILGGGLIIFGTLLLEIRGLHPSEEHLESHLTERKTSRV